MLCAQRLLSALYSFTLDDLIGPAAYPDAASDAARVATWIFDHTSELRRAPPTLLGVRDWLAWADADGAHVLMQRTWSGWRG